MSLSTNRKSLLQPIRHSLGRWCVATGVTFLIVPALNANAEISWPPPAPIEQRVDAVVELVDRLQALVPKPLDDMTDRAFALDFDFEAAIQHVTDGIHYEPYRGVLRGPDGTATMGAGNAWDQALLLASLIKTIGGDAQIVSGALSDADARRLLEQAFVRPTAHENDTLDTESIAAAIGKFDPELAKRYRDRMQTALRSPDEDSLAADSAEIADTIARLVRGSERSLPASRAVDGLVEAVAENYAWVRWRTGPNSDWANLHPAFGQQTAPSATPKRYIDDSVPAEFQHRVTLQLFIERGIDDDDGKTELVPVMSRWDRPTANLHKNQVYLGMAPQSLDGSPESAVLVPTLNGAKAPGGQAVTWLGLTADPADAATAAGKLFATVSSRGGKATGALAGMSEEGPARIPRLLGVILKAEIDSPDGRRTVTRRVADLRGLSESAFPRAGAFQMILDVHVGPGDPKALYHGVLDYFRPFVQAVPPLIAFARGAVTANEIEASNAYRNLGSPRWLDFELAAGALLAPPTSNRTTFRSGPMLIGRRTNTLPTGELVTMIDILSNPSTVLAREEDESLHLDTQGAIAQGVRETLLESWLARDDDAWKHRRPEHLVTDRTALDRSGSRMEQWPAAAKEAAGRDLEDGYLVAIADDSQPFWWRVDPSTGETLGMGTHGGSEFTEYLIATGGIGISVFLFAQSVESCDEQYADNRAMADCCIVGNLGATYATSGASAAGAAATTTGNALYAASGSIKSALGWTAADLGAGYVIGELDIVGAACRAHLNQ